MEQPASTICPCCGNWKMYDAPKCHNCYQDDLKKAIDTLKEIRKELYSALLYKRINKGVAENIDANIRGVLSEIEEVKSQEKSKMTFSDLP